MKKRRSEIFPTSEPVERTPANWAKVKEAFTRHNERHGDPAWHLGEMETHARRLVAEGRDADEVRDADELLTRVGIARRELDALQADCTLERAKQFAISFADCCLFAQRCYVVQFDELVRTGKSVAKGRTKGADTKSETDKAYRALLAGYVSGKSGTKSQRAVNALADFQRDWADNPGRFPIELHSRLAKVSKRSFLKLLAD
jgi:hypothetical protein